MSSLEKAIAPASIDELARSSGAEARAAIRAGRWRRPTTGVAMGYVQANLVVVPEQFADSFREFCLRNSQACPLLDELPTGSPEPASRLAVNADLRTDVPRYRVYENGAMTRELDDLRDIWQPDLVAFLLGCSLTFESALAAAGVPLRHIELGSNVAMYRTSRACQPAGPFAGPLVVSMRPVPDHLVALASQVTSRFSKAHGAPVHAGDPAVLGITDFAHPDYGDAVPLLPGETPVFWACGVTPQAAAERARLPLMLTHAPGHMFITDLRDAELEGLTPL